MYFLRSKTTLNSLKSVFTVFRTKSSLGAPVKRRGLKMMSYKCLKGYTQGRSKDLISVRQESLLKIESDGKN